VLAKVHPRFATPYISIMVYAGIGFVMEISGGFKQMAIFASASLLLIYLGVALATIRLMKKYTITAAQKNIPGTWRQHYFFNGGGIVWLLSNSSKLIDL
jgi:APA family basic amino acid/polyamine antiporter